MAPKWSTFNRKKHPWLTKNFRALLDSIPLTNATVQNVFDSGDQRIPPVVLIQDVHLNTEAQTNIASALQLLIDQKQIGLVGVEGAFQPFDFKPFRSLPNKQVIKEVATAFFNNNRLSAPSYVGITSSMDPPLFVGVDDKNHYTANVKAYLSSKDRKAEIQKRIKIEEQRIQTTKKKVFSPDLARFDSLRTAYHKGDLGIGPYLKKLDEYTAETDFAMDQFLEAYELESSLDFIKVESERRDVIEKLTKRLTENEISTLVEQSLAYRTGRLSFGGYYQGLKNLCEQKGISLNQTPAFENYIRYVLLSDGIKATVLFDAIENRENQILSQLATTPEQKQLLDKTQHLYLTKKLIDFSLTPKQWEKYKTLRENDASLASFEEFYEQADIRSHKMVENLLSYPTQGNKVLVIGGFHTPLIANILRKQKVSFVVVSPKITKIESRSGSSYLSVFAREKTPLDKIFEGKKLFLAPHTVHLTNAHAAVPLLAAIKFIRDRINPVLIHWRNEPLRVTVPDNLVNIEEYDISRPRRQAAAQAISSRLLWKIVSIPLPRKLNTAKNEAWFTASLEAGRVSALTAFLIYQLFYGPMTWSAVLWWQVIHLAVFLIEHWVNGIRNLKRLAPALAFFSLYSLLLPLPFTLVRHQKYDEKILNIPDRVPDLLEKIKNASSLEEVGALARELGMIENIDFMDALGQIEEFPGYVKEGGSVEQQTLDHAKKFLELYHATFDENGVPEGRIVQPVIPDTRLRDEFLTLFPLERINKGIEYIRSLFREEGESPVVSLNALETIRQFQEDIGIKFDVYGVLEYMGIRPDGSIEPTFTGSFKRRQFIEKLIKSGHLYSEGEEEPGKPLTMMISSSGNAIQGLLHEVQLLVEQGVVVDGKTLKLPKGSKVVMVAHDTLSPAKKEMVEKKFPDYTGGVFYIGDFVAEAQSNEIGMFPGESPETVQHRLENINALLAALDEYVTRWNKVRPDEPKMHVRASNEESAMVGGASILRNAREQLADVGVDHVDYVAMGRGGGGPVAGMALEAHHHKEQTGQHTTVLAVGSDIPTVSIADGQAIQNAQSLMQETLRAFPDHLKSGNVDEKWFYKAMGDMHNHRNVKGLSIQAEASSVSGLAKLYSIMADPSQWHLLQPNPDGSRKTIALILSGHNYADYVADHVKKVRRKKNMRGLRYIFGPWRYVSYQARRYFYYAVFVQWELIFSLLIPLSNLVTTRFFPGTPILSSLIPIIVWLISSALFARSHPNRTWPRLFTWSVVGLGLGAPYLFFGLDFWTATYWSVGLHAGYNALVITARIWAEKKSVKNNFPWFDSWVDNWLPLASSRISSVLIEIMSRHGFDRDLKELYRWLVSRGRRLTVDQQNRLMEATETLIEPLGRIGYQGAQVYKSILEALLNIYEGDGMVTLSDYTDRIRQFREQLENDSSYWQKMQSIADGGWARDIPGAFEPVIRGKIPDTIVYPGAGKDIDLVVSLGNKIIMVDEDRNWQDLLSGLVSKLRLNPAIQRVTDIYAPTLDLSLRITQDAETAQSGDHAFRIYANPKRPNAPLKRISYRFGANIYGMTFDEPVYLTYRHFGLISWGLWPSNRPGIGRFIKELPIGSMIGGPWLTNFDLPHGLELLGFRPVTYVGSNKPEGPIYEKTSPFPDETPSDLQDTVQMLRYAQEIKEDPVAWGLLNPDVHPGTLEDHLIRLIKRRRPISKGTTSIDHKVRTTETATLYSHFLHLQKTNPNKYGKMTWDEYRDKAWYLENWHYLKKMVANKWLIGAYVMLSAILLSVGWNDADFLLKAVPLTFGLVNLSMWAWFVWDHILDVREHGGTQADGRAPPVTRKNVVASAIVAFINSTLGFIPVFLAYFSWTSTFDFLPLAFIILASATLVIGFGFGVHWGVNKIGVLVERNKNSHSPLTENEPAAILIQKNRTSMGDQSQILVHVPQINKDIYVFRDVFNPTLTNVSPFLADHNGVQEGDVVLDVGSGSGYQAIVALHQGAEKAVSLEKLEQGVWNIRANVTLLGLEGRQEARQSDLFSALGSDEKFSLILFNPPLLNGAANTPLEGAIFDENYKLLRRFLEQSKKHLSPNGRIRMTFSSKGIDVLEKVAETNGFAVNPINQITRHGEIYYVLELTVHNDPAKTILDSLENQPIQVSEVGGIFPKSHSARSGNQEDPETPSVKMDQNQREDLRKKGQVIADFLMDRSLYKTDGTKVPIDTPLAEVPDVMIVFGIGNEWLPRAAARMFIEGRRLNSNLKVIFTGGLGRGTPKRWAEQGKSEAVGMKDLFLKQLQETAPDFQVDDDDLITEENSTNAGGNAVESGKLLRVRGIKADTVVLLHHPFYQTRGAYATWAKQAGFENQTIINFSPYLIDFDKLTDDQLFAASLFVTGEINRLRDYPGQGFTVPIDLNSILPVSGETESTISQIQNQNPDLGFDHNAIVIQDPDFGDGITKVDDVAKKWIDGLSKYIPLIMIMFSIGLIMLVGSAGEGIEATKTVMSKASSPLASILAFVWPLEVRFAKQVKTWSDSGDRPIGNILIFEEKDRRSTNHKIEILQQTLAKSEANPTNSANLIVFPYSDSVLKKRAEQVLNGSQARYQVINSDSLTLDQRYDLKYLTQTSKASMLSPFARIVDSGWTEGDLKVNALNKKLLLDKNRSVRNLKLIFLIGDELYEIGRHGFDIMFRAADWVAKMA